MGWLFTGTSRRKIEALAQNPRHEPGHPMPAVAHPSVLDVQEGRLSQVDLEARELDSSLPV